MTIQLSALEQTHSPMLISLFVSDEGVMPMQMCVQLPSPFHLLPEQSSMDCPQRACLLLFCHMKPLPVFVISNWFIAYTYIMYAIHAYNT